MTDTVPSAAYLAESRAALLNVFYSIPIPLEVFTTLFRIWVKLHHKTARSLAFDDYLMMFATAVAVNVCAMGLAYGAPYGLGRHIEAVSEYEMNMFLKGDYIFSHFYNLAIGTTKLSILFLYYNIFSSPTFRKLIVATIILVTAWVVGMEVVMAIGCRPIEAWWGEAEGTCVNKEKFTYSTNITNLLFDLWIFSMPLPILLRLNMTTSKKMGLCMLFSIGLGTCAISAARLSFVFGVASADFTWNIAPFGILSAWEPCGGILCANLPIVYKSFRQYVEQARATITGGSSNHPHSDMGSGFESPINPSGQRHDWIRLNTRDLTSDKVTSISANISTTQPKIKETPDIDGVILIQKHFSRQESQQKSHSDLSDGIYDERV